MIIKVNPALFRQVTPKSGVLSTRELNAAIGSALDGLRSVVYQTNSMSNLFNTMPGGGVIIDKASKANYPDVFVNGVDGANIFIDNGATASSDNGEFFDTTNTRPLTIKEYTVSIKNNLSARLSNVESDISVIRNIDSTGLTVAEKQRIGINIFDTAQQSSPTSLDGLLSIIDKRVQQITADVFNTGTSIGDPVTSYTYTGGNVQSVSPTILERVITLETTVSGLSLTVTSQVDVPSTATSPSLVVDDNYSGSPTTLADDLNQLRTIIRVLKGTAAWDDALATMPDGQNSLNDILTYQGTASVGASADNIFANDVSDFSDDKSLLGVIPMVADEPIPQYSAVYISGNNVIRKADASALNTSYVIGITIDDAPTASVSVRVMLSDHIVIGGISGATGGDRYYLSDTVPGALTTVIPSTSGSYIVRIGAAKNATDLIVKISDPIGVI